ncbi:OmpH family outer membrane protein [Bacteroidia bacterium]|jgi:outer membrane protein|nr:OmpH family outer membrane protein [Bacteroidia bacterium]MDC0104411.1 OmpH family outer membrane protein [Bacteroidia bacterium]|tara:strand:- start:1568 stop:2077 length:510 start_codon:yes stop_codon:yes gene_type:complete
MKKVLVILTLVCSTFAAQAQTKVGHINSSNLLEMLPEADSIQKQLAQVQEMWQRILAEKETEAKTKYNALMIIIDKPSVSDSEKEIKTQEVENLQKQYQELQKRANDDLQIKQEELLSPLLEKVKKTISEVAKANGYAYVMDTTEGSGIIYSDSSFDLMPLVKAKLGVK